MNEVLQKIIDTAPIYQEILQQEIAISVSDMEKYLYILDTDTLKFPCKVGTRIDSAGYDTVLNTIKRTKKPMVNIVPREMTGSVPVKAIISPIFDKGEMVGLFSMSININKQDIIESSSQTLTESIRDTSESIQAIAEGAKGLNSMMELIQEGAIEAGESVKLVNDSINLIRGIATQTSFLGLNAAIEATKAGEHGKGFSVVAAEMRKLATQSKSTAEQVIATLGKIEQSVNNMLRDINEAREITNNQYESTNEVSNNIKSIANTSVELVKYSKE